MKKLKLVIFVNNPKFYKINKITVINQKAKNNSVN